MEIVTRTSQKHVKESALEEREERSD